MEVVKKLKEQHKVLKKLDITSKGFFERLKEHFELEEKVLEENSDLLGGDDELSPLGMVKGEHKLLLELLERRELERFEELFKYHLTKAETQIFTLLE